MPIRRLLRSFSAASELRRSCRKASFFSQGITAQLQITQSLKEDIAPAPSSFFSISVYPEDKFLVDCFNGGGLASSFFSLPLAVVVVEERF